MSARDLPLRRPALLLAAVVVACSQAGRGDPSRDATPDRPPPPAEEPPPIEAGRAPASGPYAPGVDVLHYEVALDLRSGAGTFTGRTVVRLRRTSSGTERLELDLTGLAVDSVRIGAVHARDPVRVERAAYREGLERGRLRVPLPAASSTGDSLAVEVFYRGSPDDGLILDETLHGVSSAFVDNWPNRARFWFPSVDHPSDKATVSFEVRAPSEWQVVANGALLSSPVPVAERQPVGGASPEDTEPRRLWRWRTRAPIPTYTMVVGATSFEVRRRGLAACGRAPLSPRADGCVEVTTWLYPRDTARAAPSFRRAAEMVDHFAETIGPFPYEKLAHVQSSTRFGGMENASAIFYSEAAIGEGRDIEGTVAHEVAHQWFGDAVTEADWHHLWLSEGFATYFGAVFFEHADGEAAFREIMARHRRTYLDSDAPERPVVDEEEDDLFALLNPNNYQKGAWVLHMLRDLVGEEAFRRGIRTYYERFLHGTALTEDFREVVEEVSGRSLGWFFEQWLFRPGHPVVALDWSWDDDRDEAHVTVRQEQPERWPTFRLPATIEIASGDGAVRRERIELSERVERHRFRLPERPAEIRFDPDDRLLVQRADGEVEPDP